MLAPEKDYKSIMSVAIRGVRTANFNPDEDAELVLFGVLNITSANENAFSREDCAWIDTVASLVGAMYNCYDERLKELGAGRKIP